MLDIELTAPGAGNTGNVDINTGDLDITLDLNTLGFPYPWLLYDWDGDAAHDDDPAATATFGIYSGNDKNIYKLQIYRDGL